MIAPSYLLLFVGAVAYTLTAVVVVGLAGYAYIRWKVMVLLCDQKSTQHGGWNTILDCSS